MLVPEGTSLQATLGSPAVKVFSHIVRWDTGFAPNPFHGFCTLACCKPEIRRRAAVGDLIIGMTSRSERIVYAMQVSAVIGFADYWTGVRYAVKRPVMNSPHLSDRCGDNIYEPTAIGEFRQLHSRHSNADGSEKVQHKERDLGGVHVLVADRFVYFGGEGPSVPAELGFLEIARGHRCRFTPEQIAKVTRWFGRQPPGLHGEPALGPASKPSCGPCRPS